MKRLLTVLTAIFPFALLAQNLVPNPSFESLTSCPDNFFQIYKAPPWFSPDCGNYFPDHGNAVLFNACNSSFASVPANSVCTQYARTGVGYAGVEVLSVIGTNYHTYRQYLETKLSRPLIKGTNYYFSMYFNFCDRFKNAPLCFRADSLGVVFSADSIDKNPGCLILPLKPDIHANLPPVVPGSQWHKVDGSYIAKGGEEFIIIGNYAGEEKSNCSPIDTLAYFLFIDDVSLIPEIRKTTDTSLCPGESWVVDGELLREEYQTISGWTYQWSNGDTVPRRRFTATGNEKLTVRLNGSFYDEYLFNVKVEQSCGCTVIAPNAFSPNGDGLNDYFLPQIKCKSILPANYQFSVYNRWGEKIFLTNDITKGWDGKYRGKFGGNEIFLWMVQYDINDGGKITHKKTSGTITIIK